MTVRNTSAEIFFRSSDSDGMAATGVVAAAMGLSGAAAGMAAMSMDEMKEPVCHVSFDIDGKHVEAVLWNWPFKNGDEVQVVVEPAPNGGYTGFAVLDPKDRVIVLYSHVSAGRKSHWKNVLKLSLLGGMSINIILISPIPQPLVAGSATLRLDNAPSSRQRRWEMGINLVQFQPGLSLSEFMDRYGTEAKCYRALYRWRWPKGFRCPQCDGRARSRFRRDDQVYYQCRACRHQTTLRAGTLLQSSKLSLRLWMQAMYLLTSSKTNLAALELKRHLGVTYKAAWRMKHKIMQAMTEREEPRKLKGFVQIDDAYLGGERSGGKRGRGSENKQPFVIAVQVDHTHEHPVFAVIEPVKAFDNASLEDWIARRLEPECEVYSDGLACFRRLEEAGHAHTTLDTGGGRAATDVQGARWLNVVLGNVKRAISGTYHAVGQAKYARRYLAEAAYRFNRRFDLKQMLPRLATALLRCTPCPERVLRMASNFHG
ncbi:ISXo2 putative transposase [Xanthomonas oryzae pv. oryzae PXO99A]|uniref:ISXo2 putative transposase n=64 Tax=Xanthomonas oryzae TaxID=347 RepID=A0A0K0GIY0_XANOP|nr:ISXo2 putative transposase [Xanthomonas oryzae pv. oryzae PXO99A]